MITVVITSYKYGHLVSHAIESVLSQTKKPDKILVVDDGIGDVKVHADRYGLECIERVKNMGVVANFQDILMNHIKTEKVMFLGADNWLRQDALELMTDSDADIVSSDMALTGENYYEYGRVRGCSEVVDGYLIWRLGHGDITKGNYIHGSSVYNVDLAKKVGGYSRGHGTNAEEDWQLWRKMLAAKATHEHIPDYLLFYRRHKANFNKV